MSFGLKDDYLSNLNERIAAIRKKITDGVENFDKYQNAVGQLRGLEKAAEIFEETFSKYMTEEEGDDDDEYDDAN